MKTLIQILTIGLSLVAFQAAAHSALKSSEPAQGSVLTVAPGNIQLSFDDGIRLTSVSLGKERLSLPKQSGFGQEFDLPLPMLIAGDYVVEWRGLSQDGHALSGSVAFSVQ